MTNLPIESVRYLLSGASCSDDNAEHDCSLVVIPVTPQLIELIRGRMTSLEMLFASDPNIYEIYYWDYRVRYFKYAVVAELEAAEYQVDALYGGGTVLPAPSGFDPDRYADHEVRTEINQMSISISTARGRPDLEVKWTASPKHSNVYVVTGDVTLDMLHQLFVPASAG